MCNISLTVHKCNLWESSWRDTFEVLVIVSGEFNLDRVGETSRPLNYFALFNGVLGKLGGPRLPRGLASAHLLPSRENPGSNSNTMQYFTIAKSYYSIKALGLQCELLYLGSKKVKKKYVGTG